MKRLIERIQKVYGVRTEENPEQIPEEIQENPQPRQRSAMEIGDIVDAIVSRNDEVDADRIAKQFMDDEQYGALDYLLGWETRKERDPHSYSGNAIVVRYEDHASQAWRIGAAQAALESGDEDALGCVERYVHNLRGKDISREGKISREDREEARDELESVETIARVIAKRALVEDLDPAKFHRTWRAVYSNGLNEKTGKAYDEIKAEGFDSLLQAGRIQEIRDLSYMSGLWEGHGFEKLNEEIKDRGYVD